MTPQLKGSIPACLHHAEFIALPHCVVPCTNQVNPISFSHKGGEHSKGVVDHEEEENHLGDGVEEDTCEGEQVLEGQESCHGSILRQKPDRTLLEESDASHQASHH